MKGRVFVATAALLACVAGVGRAQGVLSSSCAPDGTIADRATQDACQLATDVFRYMTPQLGLALSGGNATLGQGGTLGGIGHFAIGVRGNVFNGSLPQIQDVELSVTGAQRRRIETDGQIIGLPTVDAAVGLFQGIPLGVTNVGGIDLLLSAMYVPTVTSNGFDVSPDNPIKFGFGARLGLVQESLLLPGVSITFLRRELPSVDITASAGIGPLSATPDTIYVRDIGLTSNSWRFVASKSFLSFGVAAGVGQDRFSAETAVEAAIQPRPPATTETLRKIVAMEQDMTRLNMFLDLSLNLPFTKFVLEVGQTSGGSVVEPFNDFSGKAADASRVYGSLGVRFGF